MVIEQFATGFFRPRVVRAVVVLDLVESVRLIEQYEDDVIARWRTFSDRVRTLILPAHQGRMVKSLGDGMMLEFPDAVAAVQAAFEVQRAVAEANAGIERERQLLLRIGAHIGEVIADDHDVYGHGVNLAARLCSLARPGEVVASADLRDQLTAALDADIEDLGECWLKHVQRPQRAYRLYPPGEPGTAEVQRPADDLLPTVAVIPFWARSGGPNDALIGEVLADEIISALACAGQMNVISRLSTTVLRGRAATMGEAGRLLDADFVVSGSYQVNGRRLVLLAQLTEASSGTVLWSGDLKGSVAQLLNGSDQLIDSVVADVTRAMMTCEVRRVRTQSLATLESYALLLGGVSLMHRLSRADFDRARDLLQALIERLPRQAIPYAWLAKWHVLRVQQGWTDDASMETRQALAATRRALDLDPTCSLALAIDGFVHTNLLKELDVAAERYDRALEVNPNESIAWLLRGTLHAFKGEGGAAVRDTRRALRLSPLDPMRYFYDALSATAALSAEQYERALVLADRSLRANRTHASTLRVRIVALWRLSRFDEARSTAAELLRVDPSFTVGGFLDRSPAGQFRFGRKAAEVFLEAGVPK